MRTATELKETILQKAGELFAQQGYTATSNKQIAKAAGCTTAALYYYFEGGKSQILREVIGTYSLDLSNVLEIGKDVENLHELLLQFGQSIAHTMPEVIQRINWLQPEFPRLAGEEKAIVQNLFLSLHNSIAGQIARFVTDEKTVARLAWLLFCAYFGYEQVFLTMEMSKVTSLNINTFAEVVADSIQEQS